MWRPRVVPVAVIWLAASLGAPGSGVAQGLPGYRIRFPAGGSLGGQVGTVGAPVRAPRLIGTPQTPRHPVGRRFGSQFVVPYPYFGWYSTGSTDGAYPDDSTADYSPAKVTEPEPSRDVYPVFDSGPEVGPLEVSTRQIGSKVVVRLSWRENGLAATQVAFFLADSAKVVLSAQTDRSTPFTAQFEPPPRTAFAGMTVVLPGGNLVTRYVVYRE
jgi:hypothetical protein